MCVVYVKRSNNGMESLLEPNSEEITAFLLRKLRVHHQGTYFHSVRVSSLCAELFDLFGIRGAERERMLRSALLHDIGKIRIGKEVLEKQGRLTNDEWALIKTHCSSGISILNSERMGDSIDPELILYHHENLDGSGYYGLTQFKLSLGQRIIRVADSYDAMMEPRSYNKARSTAEVFEELRRLSGIHYDSNVVDALCRLKLGI